LTFVRRTSLSLPSRLDLACSLPLISLHRNRGGWPASVLCRITPKIERFLSFCQYGHLAPLRSKAFISDVK
jgi:hypothetical protein